MIESTPFITAVLTICITPFLLGLFSSLHCIGMCGGVMSALSFSIAQNKKTQSATIIFFYNLGRIFSYTLMGLLLGFFAEQLIQWSGFHYLRWLAGLMLIVMGLYLAGWWSGLVHLETLGRYLWQYLQPLSKLILPVNSMPKALVLGAIWGWLPCGLIYSMLVYAIAQASFVKAGLAMFAFGIGTLPSMIAAGFFADSLRQWLQSRIIRYSFAVLVIILGIWTFGGTWMMGVMSHSHSHMH
jgi:uncharacterized protein